MTKVRLTKVQAQLLSAYAGLGDFPAHANGRTVDKLREHQLIRGHDLDDIEVTVDSYIWLGRVDLIEITHAAECTLIRLDESVMGTRPRHELTFTADDEAALVAHDLITRSQISIDGDPANYLITITDRGRYDARELRGRRKATALGLVPGDVLTITIPGGGSRAGVETDMVIDRLDDNGGHLVGPKGYRHTICFGYSALDMWTIERTGRGSDRCMCPPEVIAGGHWPGCRLEVPDESGVDVPVYDVTITLQTRAPDGGYADLGGPFKFGEKDTRTRAHTADLFTQIADGWADIAIADGWIQVRVVVACSCGCGLEASAEREAAAAAAEPVLAAGTCVRAGDREGRITRTWTHPEHGWRMYEVVGRESGRTLSLSSLHIDEIADYGWDGVDHPVLVEITEYVVDGAKSGWGHVHTNFYAAAGHTDADLSRLADDLAHQWASKVGRARAAVTVPGRTDLYSYATAGRVTPAVKPATGQPRPGHARAA